MDDSKSDSGPRGCVLGMHSDASFLSTRTGLQIVPATEPPDMPVAPNSANNLSRFSSASIAMSGGLGTSGKFES